MGTLLTLKADQRRLRHAIAAFTRGALPKQVDVVVRKVAFDVVSETAKSMNGGEAGYPNPKRIDTGRLRAGWSTAGQSISGHPAGPTTGYQPGDSTVTHSGRGLTRTIAVENAVEYGPYVEFGTSKMAPGNHLGRALNVAAQGVEDIVLAGLTRAWNE